MFYQINNMYNEINDSYYQLIYHTNCSITGFYSSHHCS